MKEPDRHLSFLQNECAQILLQPSAKRLQDLYWYTYNNTKANDQKAKFLRLSPPFPIHHSFSTISFRVVENLEK